MDQAQDFKSLQDQIQATLIATTRTAGQISSEDLAFQRSLNPEVGTALDEQSERILGVVSALLKSAASISELRAPTLQEPDDVENHWRGVVDVVDSLLEKTDTCLDEYTGLIKRKDPAAAEQEQPSKPKKTSYGLGNAFRTQNLLKPQLTFDVEPDNKSSSPWKPLLETKPHAIKPLEESLGTFTNEFDQQQYRHPYEMEILQLKYPASVYTKADPIPYLPVEGTSATFVDTEAGVMEMLNELKSASVIAVDLEHHDVRSYTGLVSLMQISTRTKDWIIDTLKPWRQNLQVLNEVFADPKIIKVFHGAYMDIVWLQRDLGLYIVGLFDTYWASRTLEYQGGSLAFLLKKFIDFDADKKYQMADWRIRPLPEEMFFYARADTHFLLYIYDNMRNELIDWSNNEIPEENRIEIVLQKSKEVSLLRYERQVYNTESGRGPGGWYSLLIKTPALFNNEQFSVFRAVHGWRDKIARLDDDSTAFIMPNHAIFSIAKVMPMDIAALLSIVRPISHSVKSRASELLEVIKSARAGGKNGPSMMDVLRPDSVGAVAKANLPSTITRAAAPALVAVVDQSELRSESSIFWGGTFGSSVWDTPSSLKKDEGLRLAVSLPVLSSEIFAPSDGSLDRSKRRLDSSRPDTAPLPKQVQTEEVPFVLKRGGKRNIEAVSDSEEAGGEYDISLNDVDCEVDETRQKAERKERRAEKKRMKAEKKALEVEVHAVKGDEDDDEPFDYSKAESVLHGSHRKDGKSGGGGKGKKPFDPYQKSTDAPNGMRRVQTERAGKSHTFRS